MVKIGQKVHFDPFFEIDGIDLGCLPVDHKHVVGTIIEIHEDHKWFSVLYGDDDGYELRTSFCFADIGVSVFMCEEEDV